MKSVLIICLTSILFAGCVTLNSKERWPSPLLPQTKSVKIIPIKKANIKQDGFYMDLKDATNLANNVDELEAYIEKLEAQIKKMKKYYGAK